MCIFISIYCHLLVLIGQTHISTGCLLRKKEEKLQKNWDRFIDFNIELFGKTAH